MSGTSFTDSTAVNGTTYYYVVESLNGGCSSGNSSQASATPTTFRYDPYGISADPITDTPTGASSYVYRYTGQRLDPFSLAYDYKARAYEPGIGRFLQTDLRTETRPGQ